MDPATIALLAAGGAQLGSSLIQAYNSARARNASAAELRKIEDLINKVESPNFNPADIMPEDYEVVVNYAPEIAPLIAEVAPQALKESEAARAAQETRRRSLDQLMKVVSSGEDPIAAIERERGARRAAAEAASARATLDRDFARRGALNSGLQYAGALGAGDAAAARMALEGEQAVMNREQARRGASVQAGTLGGQVYDDAMWLEKQNVDAINDFNRRIAERGQNYVNQRANLLNEAQRYNLGNRQRIAEGNVDLANKRAAARQGAQQQMYENAMDKIGMRQGIANQRRGDIIGAGQDRNQMIKGFGDMASGAASTYYADQRDQENKRFENEQRERDRQAYGRPSLMRN
jgi:hypothetical protein